jgi:hypothetical protein
MPTETLSFSLRDVDGIPVLDFKGGGCRPASDAEVELLAEIDRLSKELSEAKEAALRYQTIAGEQGNMLMRKSLLLEMAMAYVEYDEAEFLVSEAASIIRYGIENPGEPLPWPSSPGLQKWLVGKGWSNCDGNIGMRLTMRLTTQPMRCRTK